MPSISQSRLGSKGLSEEFSFRKRRHLWSRLVEERRKRCRSNIVGDIIGYMPEITRRVII